MSDSQPFKTLETDISVSSRLVSERQKRGFQQTSLADALDVSPRTVSRWEQGTPIPSDKIVACQKLGLDMVYVLFGLSEGRKSGDSDVVELNAQLLEDIIERVESITTRPIYAGKYDPEKKARVICSVYRHLRVKELMPQQEDVAILTALDLAAG